MTPCEQRDNIHHIQLELANHKVWRKETTSQLTNIEVSLATINDRLKADQKYNVDTMELKMQKFDDHVKDGTAFRFALIITMLGLAGTFITGFISYGKMEQKVDHLYSGAK